LNMKISHIIFSFCLAIAFAGACFGEESRKSGLVLLTEPVGARSAALAGAMSSVNDDQTALYANPSAVALLERKDFTITHHSAISGIRQFQSGWAYGTGSVGIGLSLGIHTIGGFEIRTGPTTNPIGSFNLFEFNAAFTYGQRLASNLYGGFSARFLHEDLEASRASGFGLDLGFTYLPEGTTIALSASVLNLGRMDELNLERSSLPREIRVGASYRRPKALLSADYRIPRFGSSGILIGAEVSPAPFLALRAGFQSGHDTRTMSYGLGLTRQNWRIDYAFIPTDLGFDDSHRVTLGIR
jgi:hypothetical protein